MWSLWTSGAIGTIFPRWTLGPLWSLWPWWTLWTYCSALLDEVDDVFNPREQLSVDERSNVLDVLFDWKTTKLLEQADQWSAAFLGN